MADRNDLNPGNVPGPFYVDRSCIDCDMCRELAPASFRRSDEIGLSIVYQQPSSPEEEEAARKALESCPTGSIGEDGGPGVPV